jgi:hypothetical protein
VRYTRLEYKKSRGNIREISGQLLDAVQVPLQDRGMGAATHHDLAVLQQIQRVVGNRVFPQQLLQDIEVVFDEPLYGGFLDAEWLLGLGYW